MEGEPLLTLGVLVALFAATLVLGWQFWHGKWLKLIAGNNMAEKKDYGTPYQRRLGLIASCVMYAAALALFSHICYALLQYADIGLYSEYAKLAMELCYGIFFLVSLVALLVSMTLKRDGS